MIEASLTILETIAESVPLPLFVLIASIIEELIAFIPSPFVLTLAGSSAAAQGSNFLYLVVLALIATLAKTAGAYFFYYVADKLEDVVTSKFGKVFGFSHKSIESIGAKLQKSSSDEVAIFLLRAMPLIPSTPVSIVAGILKIDLKRYLLASAAGLFVRCMFFVYLGYTATGTLEDLTNQIGGYELYGKIALLILGAIGVIWFWRKRRELVR